jgi:hypothetical protein
VGGKLVGRLLDLYLKTICLDMKCSAGLYSVLRSELVKRSLYDLC